MGNANLEPEEKQLIHEDPLKKPYLKPAFRFEQVFVTTALSCGKLNSTETQCRLNTKAS